MHTYHLVQLLQHTHFSLRLQVDPGTQKNATSLQLQSGRIDCSKAAAMNRSLDAASKRTGILFKGGTNRYILGVKLGKQNALCCPTGSATIHLQLFKDICISYEKQQHKDGIENQQQERCNAEHRQ